jgi:LPS export ABC transporter protein LptC
MLFKKIFRALDTSLLSKAVGFCHSLSMKHILTIIRPLKEMGLAMVFILTALLPQVLFLKRTIEGSTPYKTEASSGHNMEEMQLKRFQSGMLDWVLNSKRARSFMDGEWELEEVDGQRLNNSKEKIDFSSDRGETNLKKKSFSLIENVKAESTAGYKFETDSLVFETGEEGQKFFKTSDPVKIYNVGEELEILSVGLKGETESGVVELLSEVSCKKSVKNYKDILIQSDSAEFKSSLKSIRFRDNLRVSQEKFKIKGEEAYFVYDEQNKTLKSVQIDGDILASDGVKTAMSETVEMRTTEDVIIFQGNPRIRMGKNEMIGQEILITNKQKNIQVIRGNIKSTKQGVKVGE